MAWPLRVHSKSVELSGKTDGGVANVNHFLDLSVTFDADLAHLRANHISQRFM
jgi:hypothetical protein